VTGHALHLGVLDRLDDDVVADPVDADLADFLGRRGTSAEDKARGKSTAECSRGDARKAE